MKRLLIIAFYLTLSNLIHAQVADTVRRDSLRVLPSLVDTSKVGVDIIYKLSQPGIRGNSVQIMQSEEVTNALNNHLAMASRRRINGFRVRIYFSNAQQARNISLEVVEKFREIHPNTPVYRTYSNPNFKVTVGDFRSKSEAIRLLREIESTFPSSFVVKENINFPPLVNLDAVVPPLRPEFFR